MVFVQRIVGAFLLILLLLGLAAVLWDFAKTGFRLQAQFEDEGIGGGRGGRVE